MSGVLGLLVATATAVTMAELPRTPVGIVVLVPTSGARFTTISGLVAAVDLKLSERSQTQATLLDVQLAECGVAIACIAERARALMSPSRPVELLLVVSIQAFDEGDRVVGRLVDLTAGDGTVRGSSPPVLMRNQNDEVGAASALVDACGAELARRELWGGPARLRLQGGPPGALVELDGRAVGPWDAGASIVELGVRSGRHEVRVAAAGYLPWASSLEVEPGEHRALEVVLVAEPPTPLERVTRAAWLTSAVAASAGAGLVVWGAASVDQYAAACRGACAARGFTRLVPTDGPGAGAGPLSAPLGWSLAAGALTLVLFQALTEDGDSVWAPWLAALGVVAGSYAVSEAVNGGL